MFKSSTTREEASEHGQPGGTNCGSQKVLLQQGVVSNSFSKG